MLAILVSLLFGRSMKFSSLYYAAITALFLAAGSSVYGQQVRSPHYPFAADTTGIVEETETTPDDDSVLEAAPSMLGLSFPRNVRLVKLTLRNDERDWVDINFRYRPGAKNSYSLQLPVLEQAVYYTADWAILGANEQLVRGSFSFSFGEDAVQPSTVKEAEELRLMMRNGGPDTQFVTPPATKIILNQDPPSYDPPFTIELQDEDSL